MIELIPFIFPCEKNFPFQRFLYSQGIYKNSFLEIHFHITFSHLFGYSVIISTIYILDLVM